MANDWPPLRAASFQAGFPLFDGSGCIVTGATPSACVSKDFGAFATSACDCTELNTGAGVYTLKFSATEMTADVVIWKVTADSASARPSLGVVHTAASRQLKDLAYPATAGRFLTVDTSGQVDVRALAASSIGASQLAAGAVDNAAWGVTETLTAIPPASGLAASSFAAGAVDNNAWNVTEIVNASVTAIAASAITASVLAANSLHAAAVAASTLSSTKLATGTLVADHLGASLLTASKFAANSLHAAAVAASALPASKFGASFIELAGLSNAAASFVGTVVRTGCALAQQAVGAPPATPTLEQALMYPYMNWRNAASTTSGCIMITNDAGTVIAQAAISDSGSTFDKGEFISG
jgi:hypothetical protein